MSDKFPSDSASVGGVFVDGVDKNADLTALSKIELLFSRQYFRIRTRLSLLSGLITAPDMIESCKNMIIDNVTMRFLILGQYYGYCKLDATARRSSKLVAINSACEKLKVGFAATLPAFKEFLAKCPNLFDDADIDIGLGTNDLPVNILESYVILASMALTWIKPVIPQTVYFDKNAEQTARTLLGQDFIFAKAAMLEKSFVLTALQSLQNYDSETLSSKYSFIKQTYGKLVVCCSFGLIAAYLYNKPELLRLDDTTRQLLESFPISETTRPFDVVYAYANAMAEFGFVNAHMDRPEFEYPVLSPDLMSLTGSALLGTKLVQNVNMDALTTHLGLSPVMCPSEDIPDLKDDKAI